MTLAYSALTLGFLHGLGADHLMAIAALTVNGSAEGRRTRIMRTAVGFALGHAAVLAVGAVLAVTAGLLIPAAIASGAERVGGGLLVAMGAFGLWSIATGRAYGHIHGMPSADAPHRWHLHLSRARGQGAHRHASVFPLIVGALFAVSGLRVVMLLQPFSLETHALAWPGLLGLIVLFGLGILLSMSLFGVLLARALSIRAVTALGRTAAAIIAVASIGLGLYWTVA